MMIYVCNIYVYLKVNFVRRIVHFDTKKQGVNANSGSSPKIPMSGPNDILPSNLRKKHISAAARAVKILSWFYLPNDIGTDKVLRVTGLAWWDNNRSNILFFLYFLLVVDCEDGMG